MNQETEREKERGERGEEEKREKKRKIVCLFVFKESLRQEGQNNHPQKTYLRS
jgi:hypothetical protein